MELSLKDYYMVTKETTYFNYMTMQINTKSFKNTYLEDFIYKDLDKTKASLIELAKHPESEYFLKKIKDCENYKKLIHSELTNIKLIEYLIKNPESTHIDNIVSKYISNICFGDDNYKYQDLISNIAHKTHLTSNSFVSITNTKLNKNELIMILNKIGYQLDKIANKLINRFDDESNLKDILLKSIKTDNIVHFKERIDESLTKLKTKDLNKKKAVYLHLFLNNDFNINLLFENRQTTKKLFDKNEDLVSLIKNTIKDANKNTINTPDTNITIKNIFEWYFDSYRMKSQLAKVGIKVDIPNNLSVWDIKKTHDNLTVLVNTHKAKVNENCMRKIINKNKHLEYADNKFSVILPKSSESIFKEGTELNHCVGSYINDVLDGRSIIMFLRKNSDIDTPYYTIEIDHTSKEILQVRGKNNRDMTETVKTFIDKYSKIIQKG